MTTWKITMALKILVVALAFFGLGVHVASAEKEKRQAECFSPFYKPPWCYGIGFPPSAGFGFGGFGGPGAGGAGFGPYSGAGGFGFAGGFGPFGGGFGGRTRTRFGGLEYPEYDEDEWEDEEQPYFGDGRYQAPKFPFGAGAGAGGFAGSGFGFGGGPAFGGAGFGSPFPGAGFGSPFGYNQFTFPSFSFPTPTVTSKGPGFGSSSGSSTFSFGPGGKTTQSTSNQMVTTKAHDGTWTIQSSGLQMETEPAEGTILVTADVGRPTKVEREHVSPHEFQLNLSYKNEPKKWINLKVDEDGPDLGRVRVEQKGGTVYIRGPPAPEVRPRKRAG